MLLPNAKDIHLTHLFSFLGKINLLRARLPADHIGPNMQALARPQQEGNIKPRVRHVLRPFVENAKFVGKLPCTRNCPQPMHIRTWMLSCLFYRVEHFLVSHQFAMLLIEGAALAAPVADLQFCIRMGYRSLKACKMLK